MRKLRKRIEGLGLSFKNEMIKLSLALLAIMAFGIVLYVLKRQVFLLLLPLLFAIVFAYFQLTSYERKEKERIDSLENEFVTLFTYFSIYIADGFSVYVCLEKILQFASILMKGRIQRLLDEMDKDKSVTPFIEFAKGFDDIAIREVMISMYQMIDEGTSGAYLIQFNHLFGRLSDAKHSEEREKRMSRLDTLSFLPLAASGIAMIALVIALMDIMGGTFNVV